MNNVIIDKIYETLTDQELMQLAQELNSDSFEISDNTIIIKIISKIFNVDISNTNKLLLLKTDLLQMKTLSTNAFLELSKRYNIFLENLTIIKRILC